jgi:hypothetical protein
VLERFYVGAKDSPDNNREETQSIKCRFTDEGSIYAEDGIQMPAIANTQHGQKPGGRFNNPMQRFLMVCCQNMSMHRILTRLFET